MKMLEMPTNFFTTLQEARQWVDDNKKAGCICVCCGQIAKIYKRRINYIMARLLISLYHADRRGGRRYYHLRELVQGITLTGTADFSKLSYWNLIEDKAKDEENTKTRTSGLWMITDVGIDFVLGKLQVQDCVYLYDARPLGYGDGKVNIKDCLGTKFNYTELMSQS